jgi:hypothetical protein
MEDFKKKAGSEMMDKEIVFSKSVKAGKRIYYLDVKKNRKDEMFLTITESKKIVMGEGEASQVNFEKHKIFLYQEDFEKFLDGLNQTIGYINEKQELQHYGDTAVEEDKSEEKSEVKADETTSSDLGGDIKLDIDF